MQSLGWRTMLLTDFLWLVRVAIDLPAARSHIRMVESLLPVMTCGSVDQRNKCTKFKLRLYFSSSISLDKSLTIRMLIPVKYRGNLFQTFQRNSWTRVVCQWSQLVVVHGQEQQCDLYLFCLVSIVSRFVRLRTGTIQKTNNVNPVNSN